MGRARLFKRTGLETGKERLQECRGYPSGLSSEQALERGKYAQMALTQISGAGTHFREVKGSMNIDEQLVKHSPNKVIAHLESNRLEERSSTPVADLNGLQSM